MDDIQLAREIKLKLKERRDRISHALDIGKPSDWADYRHRTGLIKSLDDAMSDIDALTERQEIRE